MHVQSICSLNIYYVNVYYGIFPDIDDCSGVTCNGNGECVDEVSGYHCSCNNGWSGNNCDTGNI